MEDKPIELEDKPVGAEKEAGFICRFELDGKKFTMVTEDGRQFHFNQILRNGKLMYLGVVDCPYDYADLNEIQVAGTRKSLFIIHPHYTPRVLRKRKSGFELKALNPKGPSAGNIVKLARTRLKFPEIGGRNESDNTGA